MNACKTSFEVSVIFYYHYLVFNIRVLSFFSDSCLKSLCLFCKYLCPYTKGNTYHIFKIIFANSFAFVDVNVDVENPLHSDLVTDNTFVNYVNY